MITDFVYSVLTYVHSPLKKERLNAGILFYFPSFNQIIFRHPFKGLKKFKDFYSDFEDKKLSHALNSISERVWYLNNERGLFAETINENELLNKILLHDATVLRFSPLRRSCSELQDISLIADGYYDLYFSEYGPPIRREKHDENYILRTFRQRLFSENKDAQNYLQKDTIFEVPRTKVRFEYTWFNGSPNLIKPISFDLEDESSINHKAIFHFAQLNFVSQKIAEQGAKVNFLITGPSSNNPQLKKAYKNAIEILSETSVKKEIVDEKHLDSYIQEVSKKIHLPKTKFPSKNLWNKGLPPGDLPPTLPMIE